MGTHGTMQTYKRWWNGDILSFEQLKQTYSINANCLPYLGLKKVIQTEWMEKIKITETENSNMLKGFLAKFQDGKKSAKFVLKILVGPIVEKQVHIGTLC